MKLFFSKFTNKPNETNNKETSQNKHSRVYFPPNIIDSKKSNNNLLPNDITNLENINNSSNCKNTKKTVNTNISVINSRPLPHNGSIDGSINSASKRPTHTNSDQSRLTHAYTPRNFIVHNSNLPENSNNNSIISSAKLSNNSVYSSVKSAIKTDNTISSNSSHESNGSADRYNQPNLWSNSKENQESHSRQVSLSPQHQPTFMKTVLARTLYDNKAELPHELNFSRGEVITVLEQNPEGYKGWWICNIRGKIGIAPGNRLQLLGTVPNATEISGKNLKPVPDTGESVQNSLDYIDCSFEEATLNDLSQSTVQVVNNANESLKKLGANKNTPRNIRDLKGNMAKLSGNLSPVNDIGGNSSRNDESRRIVSSRSKSTTRSIGNSSEQSFDLIAAPSAHHSVRFKDPDFKSNEADFTGLKSSLSTYNSKSCLKMTNSDVPVSAPISASSSLQNSDNEEPSESQQGSSSSPLFNRSGTQDDHVALLSKKNGLQRLDTLQSSFATSASQLFRYIRLDWKTRDCLQGTIADIKLLCMNLRYVIRLAHTFLYQISLHVDLRQKDRELVRKIQHQLKPLAQHQKKFELALSKLQSFGWSPDKIAEHCQQISCDEKSANSDCLSQLVNAARGVSIHLRALTTLVHGNACRIFGTMQHARSSEAVTHFETDVGTAPLLPVTFNRNNSPSIGQFSTSGTAATDQSKTTSTSSTLRPLNELRANLRAQHELFNSTVREFLQVIVQSEPQPAAVLVMYAKIILKCGTQMLSLLNELSRQANAVRPECQSHLAHSYRQERVHEACEELKRMIRLTGEVGGKYSDESAISAHSKANSASVARENLILCVQSLSHRFALINKDFYLKDEL